MAPMILPMKSTGCFKMASRFCFIVIYSFSPSGSEKRLVLSTRACPPRENKVAIPTRRKQRLFSACCWAIDDRGKHTQHTERESGDGVFDMHGRVGNNVRNARDQEEDPRGHTHQKQQHATPEKRLLIHEERSPFVR